MNRCEISCFSGDVIDILCDSLVICDMVSTFSFGSASMYFHLGKGERRAIVPVVFLDTLKVKFCEC